MSDDSFRPSGESPEPARPAQPLDPWAQPARPAPPFDPWSVPGGATPAAEYLGSGHSEEPRRSNRRRWIAALLVVVLVGAAGTGAFFELRHHNTRADATASQPSTSPSTQPVTPTPAPSPSSAPASKLPSASPAPAGSAGPGLIGPGKGPLDSYLLAPTDVGTSAGMFLIDGGRDAVNQATLDFCNFAYTSEKLRQTRVQVEYEGANSVPVGNEFVHYGAGGSASGFAELQKAVTNCPPTSQSNGVTYSLVQRAAADRSLVPHQLVLSYQVFDTTGGIGLPWQAVAYQFDGDYFSGIYVYGASRAAALAQAERLGAVAARHLSEAVSGKPGTGGGPFQSLASLPAGGGVQV
ncbi:MAG TPA: hypothetical protein VIL94_10855 [Acidothermaceae bacterium]